MVNIRIGKIALTAALLLTSAHAFAQSSPSSAARNLQANPFLGVHKLKSGANFSFGGPSTFFVPGNLVVAVEGCGVHGGTCTTVPNGTGAGVGNSSVGGYGDNQAAPLTLFQYTPTGTSSVSYVNSLVLPQSPSGANVQVSGEYGSSSEATLQLSGAAQYLTLMGYGIDYLSFNANPEIYGTLINPKGSANYGALGQTGSLTLANQTSTGQTSLVECGANDDTTVCYPNGYTPVPRVVALIDANGNVNASTALYNIFDFNNPRSAFTANGSTVYVSGQGSGTDTTGGVFYSPVGTANNSPTAITGIDACATSSCTTDTIAQDTRTVQIYNGALYLSVDSTEGKSTNRSFIGALGDPPATSLYTPSASTGPPNVTVPTGYTTGPAELNGVGNTGGTGKITITTGANTNGNPLNNSTTVVNGSNGSALDKINLSPSNFFFAGPSVLYVADTGFPKNDSNGDNACAGASSNIGDGGLQKWVNSSSNGTGTWSLKYTLYQGLNLVGNCGSTGTTGLYGLTGVVSGSNVLLYATNSTISDFDTTYLYGITDVLANNAPPGTSLAFTVLDTAPPDSNFKGVSFAPTIPSGDVEVTSSPAGLAFTSSGTGCAPATYTTPVTLTWIPSSACALSVVSPQAGTAPVEYVFSHWQDGTTSTTDNVVAPSTTATYTATFLIAQAITFTTPPPASATYGSTFTVAATGGTSGNPVTFTNSGSCSNVGSTFTMTSGTGTCTVIANQMGSATYAAAPQVSAGATAAKVALTVTANNATMSQGAALPTFTASYSGFVDGDASAVLGGGPAFSTTATSSSPAGTYPITVTQGTLTSANYSFGPFDSGTLSVVASPTVTLTTSSTISPISGGRYQLIITATNSGNSPATNMTLTSATLGGATGATLPASFGTIAGSGGSASVTITFAASAGSPGAGVAEKYSGTYTGGTFSASIRSVTLP